MSEEFPKLYYYTTTATLQAIVTNATFWATNSLYMNDAEEYKNGLREIQRILSNKLNSSGEKTVFDQTIEQLISSPNPNSYSISFSTNSDLLSQWSMYAKESGVNLELDFSMLEAEQPQFFIDCNVAEKDEKEIILSAKPEPVHYLTKSAMLLRDANLEDKITEVDKDILHNLESNEVIKKMANTDEYTIVDGWENRIFSIVSQIKRYEFYAEEEWRLVFELSNCLTRYPIFYREQNKVLKPYVKVSCLLGGGPKPQKIPWPITAITVGPGNNQNSVFESLKHFLDHAYFVQMPRSPGHDRKVLLNYLCKLETRLKIKQELSACDRLKGYRNSTEKASSFSLSLSKYAKDVRDSLIGLVGSDHDIIENTYMSESGIILLKSEIPYIY